MSPLTWTVTLPCVTGIENFGPDSSALMVRKNRGDFVNGGQCTELVGNW